MLLLQANAKRYADSYALTLLDARACNGAGEQGSRESDGLEHGGRFCVVDWLIGKEMIEQV